MNKKVLTAVIVGFGKIANLDVNFRRENNLLEFSTHSQVLSQHPNFDWIGVVDSSDSALDKAKNQWNVPFVEKSIDSLLSKCSPDILILSTPPVDRFNVLKKFSDVDGILLEKPIGLNQKDLEKCYSFIKESNHLVQVNYWRRGDSNFRDLHSGKLVKEIGSPKFANVIYGNGLLNNGSHMIDFVKMLLGPIKEVIVNKKASSPNDGPFSIDRNVNFSLIMDSGLNVNFIPIKFEDYRENSLEIWGSKGKIIFQQECLDIRKYKTKEHSTLHDEFEIDNESVIKIKSTSNIALYNMYDNLYNAVNLGHDLWSPFSSAFDNEKLIHDILEEL